MALTLAGSVAWAQQADAKKPVEDKTLTAKDGWPIRITYFKSSLGQEAPVAILLHNKGGNRLVWHAKGGVAERLQGRGFAVITVDLRKHGESKDPPGAAGSGADASTAELVPYDYRAMAEFDLEAVKDFIFQEHQAKNLNMRKIGIVAPEFSAPIALHFAAEDWLKPPYDDSFTPASRTPRGQDVRAIVLISPEESVPGVSANPPLMTLRNPAFEVALLTQYGTEDRQNRGRAAQKMHQKIALPQNRDRTYLESYKVPLRGTDLLGKGLPVENHIIAFLDKHVRGLEGERDQWRDRQS
ncbi:MAG: alpha/beta hydrolase, partial [Planctomycetaceae bacterium]